MLTYSEILSLLSVYCGVRVARSLVFCVGFLGIILRIFVFFFFWPLRCLPFFNSSSGMEIVLDTSMRN